MVFPSMTSTTWPTRICGAPAARASRGPLLTDGELSAGCERRGKNDLEGDEDGCRGEAEPPHYRRSAGGKGGAGGRGETVLAPPPDSRRPITRSAALDAEIGTPVLRHTLGGALGARRPLLSVGDRRQAVLCDSVGLAILHRRPRPPIAERQVVFSGAALVGIAFDEHERVGVLPQPGRVAREGG